MVTEQMIEDPKKAGIPDFLQTQNRRPLTPEQQAADAAATAAAQAALGSVTSTFKKLAELQAAAATERFEALNRKKAKKKISQQAQGTWVPGCSWDPKRGRFTHPTATWNGAKWVSKAGPAAASAATSAPQPGESEVAKKSKAKKKASPKSGEGRDVSRPCGLVSDFGQVRDGTARATVVKMGLSGCTVDALAKEIGKDRATVMTHLFCLNRDCAIGYEVEDGKLSITLPGSKTKADIIKKAA